MAFIFCQSRSNRRDQLALQPESHCKRLVPKYVAAVGAFVWQTHRRFFYDAGAVMAVRTNHNIDPLVPSAHFICWLRFFGFLYFLASTWLLAFAAQSNFDFLFFFRHIYLFVLFGVQVLANAFCVGAKFHRVIGPGARTRHHRPQPAAQYFSGTSLLVENGCSQSF